VKINKEIRSQVETIKLNQPTTKGQGLSFDQVVMSQAEKLQGYELELLMKDIISQGEKLARYRTLRELVKYKRFIKSFIKETVNFGLDVSHSYTSNLNGNNRKLSIVKQIDENLIALTEAVIEQEKGSIDILDMIGEIKGLLINLYS